MPPLHEGAERMIIFDLDGTLADCTHRQHFVEAPEDHCNKCYAFLDAKRAQQEPEYVCECGRTPGMWRCDWRAFYEACDKDVPIKPVITTLNCLLYMGNKIEVWSGRCESVREKTQDWINKNTIFSSKYPFEIKMRPIGDSTPDDQLKERWLEETYEDTKWRRRTPITMVFDDRPKVVRMWRRRGIFVFDVNQTGREF
jgi:phosphoglycolate phosphatase-like HAD superfamily hydrolase